MKKTAKGLVEYCRAQLGRPYWWGTFGQTATAELLKQKRAQYPENYQAADFERQLGQKVHDCVGLIKGYRWCEDPEGAPRYVGAQDAAVDGLYRQCGRNGDISTMPDTPGACVFRGDMGHVGVYIGGGKVIEAMGHAYGVVQTELRGRGWTRWGMPDWIDYEGDGADCHVGQSPPRNDSAYQTMSASLPLLKKGAVGFSVKAMQTLLILHGFDCGPDGADGEFGINTESAVEAFQRAKALCIDGECGSETWARLVRE